MKNVENWRLIGDIGSCSGETKKKASVTLTASFRRVGVCWIRESSSPEISSSGRSESIFVNERSVCIGVSIVVYVRVDFKRMTSGKTITKITNAPDSPRDLRDLRHIYFVYFAEYDFNFCSFCLLSFRKLVVYF